MRLRKSAESKTKTSIWRAGKRKTVTVKVREEYTARESRTEERGEILERRREGEVETNEKSDRAEKMEKEGEAASTGVEEESEEQETILRRRRGRPTKASNLVRERASSCGSILEFVKRTRDTLSPEGEENKERKRKNSEKEIKTDSKNKMREENDKTKIEGEKDKGNRIEKTWKIKQIQKY